jgi:hypothetical protein
VTPLRLCHRPTDSLVCNLSWSAAIKRRELLPVAREVAHTTYAAQLDRNSIDSRGDQAAELLAQSALDVHPHMRIAALVPGDANPAYTGQAPETFPDKFLYAGPLPGGDAGTGENDRSQTDRRPP